MTKKASTVLIRFWKNVDKNGPIHPVIGTLCWLWTGSKTVRGGYGQLMDKGKLLKAHRISWELFYGSADGFFVCHKCDNPPCVNPEHLFLGSIADNNADSRSKGRAFTPDSPKGLDHHSHKLTPSMVLEIRNSKESGVSLARKYKVTKSSISRIRKRKTWKHI